MHEKEFTGSFSEKQIASVVKAELLRCVKAYTPDILPKAVLLAGQPGAGKTELSSMVTRTVFNNNGAFVNGDDYRRLHPDYRSLYERFGSEAVGLTQKVSSEVTERLIEELSSRGINLIVEGTGRTVETPKRTAELLTGKGYSVELAVIATRPEISLISTLLRFYQMNDRGTIPRATAVEAHDRTVEALPGNLDALVEQWSISRLAIWDRDLQLLFDSEMDRGWPSEALTQYWRHRWSEAEISEAWDQISFLRQKEIENGLGQSEAIDIAEERLKEAISKSQFFSEQAMEDYADEEFDMESDEGPTLSM